MELIKTPTSERIAEAVKKRMKELGIRPTRIEAVLNGRVNCFAIRRIRKGASGCILRSYEELLDFLGLELQVVPKEGFELPKEERDIIAANKYKNFNPFKK